MQSIIHYSLHFIFPALIAFVFFKSKWKKAYLIFLGTMLVDLDHLLADPIFMADRCSIGFHPLHSIPALGFYFILLFINPFFRLLAIGLLMHMATDFTDCILSFARCGDCIGVGRVSELIKAVFF